MERYDLAIVGGGINGVGIARDAAGRGLRVLLAERGDLGGATSSASSKLIHGGLRYLEHYEFRLVAEALAEREVMLRLAPHLIRPLEFVLPHEPHLRPRWMIRAGLFLYDNLGRRVGTRGSTLPRSRGVPLTRDGYGAGLKPEFTNGFVYSDASVDDARLVVLNARSAADKGAEILVRTACVGAERGTGEGWRVRLRNAASGATREVKATVLLNVAGPWVRALLEETLGIDSPGAVRLVKGSHIVVPRLYDRPHAYILQNPDKRVIFLIPYEDDFTEIGTTDVPIACMEPPPAISPDEVDYLCAAASRYTRVPVVAADVRWTWSGVRPLYDDGESDPSAITRDYHFALDDRGAPLLSIYGGKLTTYRRLAEHALERLASWLPVSQPWTGSEPLPGGDLGGVPFDKFAAGYCRRYPGLPAAWLERLLRRHGTCSAGILGDARSVADLGEDFGGGLYEREVDHFVRREWAHTAEDVLWRRTKAGLRTSPAQHQRLAERLGA